MGQKNHSERELQFVQMINQRLKDIKYGLAEDITRLRQECDCKRLSTLAKTTKLIKILEKHFGNNYFFTEETFKEEAYDFFVLQLEMGNPKLDWYCTLVYFLTTLLKVKSNLITEGSIPEELEEIERQNNPQVLKRQEERGMQDYLNAQRDLTGTILEMIRNTEKKLEDNDMLKIMKIMSSIFNKEG